MDYYLTWKDTNVAVVDSLVPRIQAWRQYTADQLAHVNQPRWLETKYPTGVSTDLQV